MIRKLLAWLCPPIEIIPRPENQRCHECAYFEDFTDPKEDPDEVNGYCCYSGHMDYGAEYGGHWTHSDEWCSGWRPAEPEATNAVDPHAQPQESGLRATESLSSSAAEMGAGVPR